MLEVKSGMRWLHHATEKSVCLSPSSEEYKTLLKSGKWHSLISDVLKSEGVVEDNNTGNDADMIVLDDLTNDELRLLCKDYKVQGYAKMKRENMIIKLIEKETL